LNDPRFVKAYEHVAQDGAHIEFRAYICCWAATQASKLSGDFVECGVNDGWLSLTICKYLDFNALGKSFYLFDTYNGIPAEQVLERERERAALHQYVDCYEATKVKFAAFPGAKLVRGRVPDTLSTVDIDKVSYLSIDMNIAKPERDAIEFFWPKLVPGGIVVLDDYAFGGYDAQHEAMDEFAASVGTSILTLPTGQGLIVK
jgi:O-methyltransferase